MVLLLVACNGSDDVDTGGPAPEPQVVRSLAEVETTAVGSPGAGYGYGMAFAGDEGVVTAAYSAGDVCLHDRDLVARACWQAESATDFAGTSLAAGPDVTGDGAPDVLVGAPGAASLGPTTGAVYLVGAPYLGGPLAGGHGTFEGEAPGDEAGTSVAFPGDVNGDGQDDVVLGAWGNDEGGLGGGKVYLFHGPIAAGTRSLATADAAILGVGLGDERHGAPTEGDGAGSVVAGVGDYDGDGVADVGLGVNGSDVGAQEGGLVAIFLGPIPAGVHDLASADFAFPGGAVQELAGDNVVGVGDVDGDGRDDVLAAGDLLGPGTVWLIPGGTPGGSLATRDTTFEGEIPGDQAGATMAGPGDLDADGARDVVIGAYGADRAGGDAGAIYLQYGPLSAGAHALADAPVIWEGESALGAAARGLSWGDLDADGVAELAVGAPYQGDGGAFAGKVYLLLDP